MARRRFSMSATTRPRSAPGVDVMGGPDRGVRLDVMGGPSPARGVDVMGGSDRGVRLDVMGHPTPAPGVDVMGGPDRGVRVDVMGHSDPRVPDAHLGTDEIGASREDNALIARRDPAAQRARRAA
jgi:hypothetical protein